MAVNIAIFIEALFYENAGHEDANIMWAKQLRGWEDG